MTTSVGEHPQWIDAATLSDVQDWQMQAVTIGAREIALFSVGDAVHATDNICTHGHARLCEGFLEGTEIECPLHQGRFDVCTGKVTSGPAEDPLRTYPVRIENGRVWVEIHRA